MFEQSRSQRRSGEKLSVTQPLSASEDQDLVRKQSSTIMNDRDDSSCMAVYSSTYKTILARLGYVVKNTLGVGSYSKVKRAVCLNGISDFVAIKIVDRTKAPQDYQLKFMPREIDIWPQLHHRNLVALFDCFQVGERMYMVMEYVPGGDALRLIQSYGALLESTARFWVGQIVDAIDYLHERDIAHRDLKLENLLLDERNSIKICDFGFVKDISGDDLSKTYCGSKSYAAPEILRGRPYDPKKVDIWAIGVILYIFVTGKMPFDETKGTKSILKEQQELKFRWPKLPPLSESCRNLILELFKWDFDERPDIESVSSNPWFISASGDNDPDKSEEMNSLKCCSSTNHSLVSLSDTVMCNGNHDYHSC